MSSPLTDAVAEAVAGDPQLLTTALTVVDRLSAPILQFARSVWGPQGAAARSSGYGGGGGGYGGGGYGPSPLDTALSALALLAFALFFLNSILPLITGGTGGGGARGGRSSTVDDSLPLDLNQEALNLITSWALSRPNHYQLGTQ